MNRALLPILLIIISIGALFFWINPERDKIALLRTQISDADSASKSMNQLNSERSRLLDQENNFNQSDLDKLKKLLPDNVDNIRLFLDIQGIASKYGTSIQDISVANQDAKATSARTIGPSNKQYGQMALSFSVETSYENLSLFLKDLEKSLRVVEIKSIGFSADNRNPDKYKVSIGINAFWLN